MSGKGSGRRPLLTDKKQFESNWDLIFKKDKKDGATDKPSKPVEQGKKDSK
jgi:hypothetical protein